MFMYLSLRVSFGIRHLDEFSALFTKRYDNSLTERGGWRGGMIERERGRVTQQTYGRITSNVRGGERRPTKA